MNTVACLMQQLNERGHPISLLVLDCWLSFVLDLAFAMGIPFMALRMQNVANFACNAVVSQGFRPPAGKSSLSATQFGLLVLR
ncbi:hypothetical protein, partial [Streptococcus pneumoniae]